MIAPLWKYALLLLSISYISCEPTEETVFPRLGRISQIETSQEDNETMWAQWQFEKPANLSLKEVVFKLQLNRTGVKPEYRYHIDHELPFRMRLDSLAPEQTYLVKIRALSRNWRPGPSSIFTLDVRKEAPSAPEILFVTQTNNDHSAEYFVTWKEITVPELKQFEVLVCEPGCHVHVYTTSTLSAYVKIPFEQKFKLNVAALYDVPIRGRFRRFSETYEGRSPPPLPQNFLTMLSAAKNGDQIVLNWVDAYGRDGRTLYFDVFVCDPILRAGFTRPGYRIAAKHAFPVLSVDRESPTGTWFHKEKVVREEDSCSPTWLANATDDYPETGGVDAPQLNDHLMDLRYGHQLQAEVKKVSRGTIRYQITIRTGFAPEYEWKKTKSVVIKPALSNVYGFTPYSPMFYAIRACVHIKRSNKHLCGNFWETTVRSATSAPSRVTNVKWSIINGTTLVIKWERPEIPNGPIDGFRVEILRGKSKKFEILKPEQLSYTYKPFDQYRTYRFGILAFNKHSDYSHMWLESELVYVHPYVTWEAWIFLNEELLKISFYIFLGLAAIAFICFQAWKHVREPGWNQELHDQLELNEIQNEAQEERRSPAPLRYLRNLEG